MWQCWELGQVATQSQQVKLSEAIMHSSASCVMLYRWLPGLDILWKRTTRAVDTCSNVRNAGKLY